MSNEALTWAFKQEGVPSGAKFVLVVLADHADEAWSCFPGQRKIARMTSMGERSVRRWLDWLEEKGFITRHQRRGQEGRRTTDRYRILQERLPTTGQPGQSPTTPQDTTTGQTGQRQKMPVGQPDTMATGESGRLLKPQVTTSGQTGQRPGWQAQPANLAGQEPSVEPSLSVSEREGPATQEPGPIPPGFALSAEMRAWAADRVPGVDAAFQTEQFVDYWLARGDRRADWAAAWRQWMRNQHKWAKDRPRPSAAAPGPGRGSNVDVWDAAARSQQGGV